MTEEQKAALDLAILNLKTHGDDQLLTAIKPLLDFYESRRAAGASEGQADFEWPQLPELPMNWACSGYDKVYAAHQMHYYASAYGEAVRAKLSAEIAALRERIAGMEKDVERYRWLAPRFTGYDFDWMPSEPEADDGKSVVVFDVGREFRGGRDVTAAIDAAIAKEPKT